jgi:hypothetical protein
LETYKLGISEISKDLEKELNEFYNFMTINFFGQQEPKIATVSAIQYKKVILLTLGWIKKFQNSRTSEYKALRLKDIFPNCKKQSASCVYNYVEWLSSSRKCSPNYQANVMKALTKLAKFMFHKQSKIDPGTGDKPYDDIPLIKELRKIQKEAQRKRITATNVSNEELKWLNWPQYLDCVQTLQQACFDIKNKTQDTKKIGMQYQVYNQIL